MLRRESWAGKLSHMRALVIIAVPLLLVLLVGVGRAQVEIPPPTPQEVMERLAVDALWSAADDFFHEGNYQRVILLNLTASHLDPHFIQAYLDAAYLLWSGEHHEQAVALYMRAAEANPDNAEIWEELGNYYMINRRNYEKAIEAFTEASNRAHEGYQIEKNLAHCYEKGGMLQEALDIWTELHRQHPEDGVVTMNLERVQGRLSTNI